MEDISLLIKSLESLVNHGEPGTPTPDDEEPEQSTLSVKWFSEIGEDIHKLNELLRGE
jgi:hypothetical protein